MIKLVYINILTIFLCCFAISNSIAQPNRPGPQILSFFSDVDDTDQPYALYLPQNYTPTKKYPFVVMLHGAGSNHRLGLRRVFGKSNANGETDVEASQYFPAWNQKEVIVAAPYARGTMGYQGIPEKEVYDMMDDVKKRFSIDEDRTYLTGLSMGGGGTLWMGLTRPDIWAAIVPVCPAPPLHTDELMLNARNLPVYFHHGDADQAVSVDISRKFVEGMKKENLNVTYDEYPGVGHDAWVNAYRDAQVFDWMIEHKRNLYPDKVTFVAQNHKYSKAYWVNINEFESQDNGVVEATFVDENKLEIMALGVSQFSIDITQHPSFNPKKKLKIDFGTDHPMKFKSDGRISFQKGKKSWGTQLDTPTELYKKEGSEGPMENVISDRHVYVYGTTGDPTEQEMEKRKKQAETAANWSYYRGEFLGRIKVYPRIVKDTELRTSDLNNSNLVLFGTARTNAIIDQFSDQLPMELKDEEDFGLAYIFPLGKNYVLINSGISILDAPESQKEWDWSSRYASTKFILSLRKFDDFVLFNKDKVIVQGAFNNQWELTEDDQKKLKKSKAIKFN